MKVVKTKGSRVLQFNKRELSVLNRARDIMMEASDKLEARFVELGHDEDEARSQAIEWDEDFDAALHNFNNYLHDFIYWPEGD